MQNMDVILPSFLSSPQQRAARNTCMGFEAKSVNRKSDMPMPFFSSARERRLWAWTLAVVGAIYATLGLATTLVEIVGNRRLFDFLFIAGFLLIGTAVLTQGLKVRPRGAEIGVVIGIGAVYLMVLARLGIPERSHLFEYCVVSILVFEAFTERASHGRRVPVPALLTIVMTSLVGVVDELIQAVLPSRVFEWTDILFNCLAALMATLAMVLLRWTRHLAVRTHCRDE